ncbi:hypothetical protein T01_12524 [Trichinella spiralis]|uniref:Uncharacterized protein n=1 Tax=Trichinella spiralis TaxID=6334 RepID=A0A0V1BWZ6_TRISP|nr:hypothetical protein T01_12524 [Trichinella spiralis]
MEFSKNNKMFLLAFNKQLKLRASSACFCAVFSERQTR